MTRRHQNRQQLLYSYENRRPESKMYLRLREQFKATCNLKSII